MAVGNVSNCRVLIYSDDVTEKTFIQHYLGAKNLSRHLTFHSRI